ncbi:MAG: hypothetical protein EBT13_03595 [Rhodobacteraceae bacterium]|nr:hypothetical protein [Paracoccaceae bacterium]
MSGKPENVSSFALEIMRCRPWIEAALEHSGGTHDFKDIVEGILAGRLQLWPAEDGCIVTEIVIYPKKTALHVFLGGGKLEQLLDMHSDVIEWAKAQGCSGVTITGRHGWKKPLESHGWSVMSQTYSKEIE